MLTHEVNQSSTVDAWESCTNHVFSIENRLCEAEGIVDRFNPLSFHFRVMIVLRKVTLMNSHQALI